MLLNNEICCSMLVRAINGKTQFKEIIGIAFDRSPLDFRKSLFLVFLDQKTLLQMD